MNHDLQQRVLETVRRHRMIRPGDRIGAGVSGGADSVALLHLLSDLRTILGISIAVLHFNHQLRGTEADEDERFVKTLAGEFQFEFVSGRADVSGESRRNGWNLEDAARRLRYRFFTETAALRNLHCVAVAHTADDQAETVLAHLFRGTGLAGLAGIYPVAGLTVRPLLEIGREELRDYLRSMGRSWREDSSNLDISRMRARIRHQLLPLLRKDFGTLSVKRLARFAELAREEEAFLSALEDDCFRALTSRAPDGSISLKIKDLLSPTPLLNKLEFATGNPRNSSRTPALALTRRLVRRIIVELSGSRNNLSARHVQNVLDLANHSSSGSQIELPGIVVRRIFNRLAFSPASLAVESNLTDNAEVQGRAFEYVIPSPESSREFFIVVPEIRRRFDLKMIDWPTATGETIQYRGALDFDRLRWPLVLRNWRAGDAYCPCGHRRVRKLKKLFLASRVPRDARKTWPVLTSAGELVWVSGYPVAREFAPRPGTQKGLLIAEEGLGQGGQKG